jgi:hypothetical protein
MAKTDEGDATLIVFIQYRIVKRWRHAFVV